MDILFMECKMTQRYKREEGRYFFSSLSAKFTFMNIYFMNRRIPIFVAHPMLNFTLLLPIYNCLNNGNNWMRTVMANSIIALLFRGTCFQPYNHDVFFLQMFSSQLIVISWICSFANDFIFFRYLYIYEIHVFFRSLCNNCFRMFSNE